MNKGIKIIMSLFIVLTISISVIIIDPLKVNRTNTNHPPKIKLLSPNGGEIHSSSILIKWNATDLDGDRIQIYIYYNISSSWEIIEENINNTGYYYWDTFHQFYYTNLSCVLKIVASDGMSSSEAITNGTFEIYYKSYPIVIVKSPNGGENWSGTQKIIWDCIMPVTLFNINPSKSWFIWSIKYSNDSGIHWYSIGESNTSSYIGLNYSYLWNTLNVSNGKYYKIRVSLNLDFASDVSNDVFSIKN